MKAACQPPATSSRWSVRRLAQQLHKQVGISKSQLQKLLREMDLQPHRFEMWLNSQDPDFEAQGTAIIGLYLQAPPQMRWCCRLRRRPTRRGRRVIPAAGGQLRERRGRGAYRR